MSELTKAQQRLVDTVLENGCGWVVPAQLRMARELQACGLVRVTEYTRTNPIRGAVERLVVGFGSRVPVQLSYAADRSLRRLVGSGAHEKDPAIYERAPNGRAELVNNRLIKMELVAPEGVPVLHVWPTELGYLHVVAFAPGESKEAGRA